MSDDRPTTKDNAHLVEYSADDPPAEARELARTVLPEPPPYVRTLADDLPDGLSDPGVAPPPLRYPPPATWLTQRLPPQEPAFGRLTRVGFGDIPQLGWVVERLAQRYPQLSPNGWLTRLRGFMNTNEHFFMKAERAVALAQVVRDAFGLLYVEPLFIFHRDRGPEGGNLKGSEGERDAAALVRAMRNWARQQRATSLRRMTECSDLPPGYIVKELGGERRDEVSIPLK